MGQLLSCPFCRELFTSDESPRCPHCDLELQPLHQLPPSYQAQQLDDENEFFEAPEHRRLSFFFWRRGRAPLLLLAIAQLALFFAPWARLLRPDLVSLSAYDLARSQAPWLWGGGVAAFVLIPLLLSRRSLAQMQGSRAIVVLFFLLSAGECFQLLLFPPSDHAYFKSGLSYSWGLYASLVCSLVASALALRFGGNLTDLRDVPGIFPQPIKDKQTETSSSLEKNSASHRLH